MIRLFAIALCLLTCGNNLRAQLAKSDTAQWRYGFNSSISYTSGNVERFLWSSYGFVRHVQNSWGFASDTRYIRGTFFGNLTEDDLLSRNFVYWQPKRRLYPYQMTWLERNRRRRMDYRIQLGIGVSWAALRNPGHLVKLSLTLGWEQARFADANFQGLETMSRTLVFWRPTFRLFGWGFVSGKTISLRYEAWVQPAFTGLSNLRVHAEGHLAFQLGQSPFDLRTSIFQTYESIALEGTRRNDLTWTVGIAWEMQKPKGL